MSIFGTAKAVTPLLRGMEEDAVLRRLISLNTECEVLSDYCSSDEYSSDDEPDLDFGDWLTLLSRYFRRDSSLFSKEFFREFNAITGYNREWRSDRAETLLMENAFRDDLDELPCYIDGLVDIMNSALLDWLNADQSRIGIVDEALADYGSVSLMGAIQVAQYIELSELAAELHTWLEGVWLSLCR